MVSTLSMIDDDDDEYVDYQHSDDRLLRAECLKTNSCAQIDEPCSSLIFFGKKMYSMTFTTLIDFASAISQRVIDALCLVLTLLD